MGIAKLWFVLVSMGAPVVSARGQAFFMGLGDLAGGNYNSSARSISADGRRVVGSSNSYGDGFGVREEAFLWTESTGMVGLGELPGGEPRSDALAISPDGMFVVGDSNSSLSASEAFIWSAEYGMLGLGDLSGGGVFSSASGVSRGGRVVVGYSKSEASGNDPEAFRWAPEGGMVGMGDLPGGLFGSEARAVSADGTVIVGYGSSDRAQQGEAFRWTEQTGMVGLGDLPGNIVHSEAFGISDNGTFIAGQGLSDVGPEAFLWSQHEGMIGLGDLSGGAVLSQALDVSDDGNIVVGSSDAFGSRAFVWERGVGMRQVQDVLLDHGIDISALGWRNLQFASGVSADGLTFVGYGAGPNGPEAWIAHVPGPPGIVLIAVAGVFAARRRRGAMTCHRCRQLWAAVGAFGRRLPNESAVSSSLDQAFT